MAFKRIYPSRAKTGWGLLQAVRKAILEEPKRLHMNYWVAKFRGKKKVSFIADYELQRLQPECGTVACLAGWTLLKAGDKEAQEKGFYEGFNRAAARLLVGNNPEAFRAIGGEWGSGLFFHYYGRPGIPGSQEYANDVIADLDAFAHKYEQVLKAHKLPSGK